MHPYAQWVAVLIDPPAWPAHGTLWSHLVSDSSLAELHAFAARTGVGRRAFDLDHYDVPAERHDALVAAGAEPVGGRELLRRLAASGLRVPARERAAATDQALLARWEAVLPGELTVGARLLARWREPHRAYHGVAHLRHALDSLDVLVAAPAPDVAPPVLRRARLALWFHDAVHDGVAGQDEERSADLAVAELTPSAGPGGPLGPDDVAEVARLVRLTAGHDPAPGDVAGALVCDADLAVLAGAPDRYARYVRQVRAEYAHVPDDAFRTGRAAVLAGLLAGGPLFRTAVGAQRWEEAARRNVGAELDALRPGRDADGGTGAADAPG